MKKSIIENVNFSLVVITILLMFIFKDKITTMLLIGGFGSLLFGITFLILKNKYGAVFVGGGFSLFMTLILYINKILDKADSITFLICSTVATLLIISLILKLIEEKKLKSKYTKEVDGICMDLIKNPNTKKEYYQPLYGYEIDGNHFEVLLPYYVDRRIPRLGELKKIRVNPKEYTDVYFEVDKITNIYYIGLCLFFSIVSIIIIVSLFI